jgi:hypothetical protein
VASVRAYPIPFFRRRRAGGYVFYVHLFTNCVYRVGAHRRARPSCAIEDRCCAICVCTRMMHARVHAIQAVMVHIDRQHLTVQTDGDQFDAICLPIDGPAVTRGIHRMLNEVCERVCPRVHMLMQLPWGSSVYYWMMSSGTRAALRQYWLRRARARPTATLTDSLTVPTVAVRYRVSKGKGINRSCNNN